MPHPNNKQGYLVIGRKTGEKLILSHPEGNIEFSVSESRGNRHRIAINAPRSVNILREELDTSNQVNAVVGKNARNY